MRRLLNSAIFFLPLALLLRPDFAGAQAGLFKKPQDVIQEVNIARLEAELEKQNPACMPANDDPEAVVPRAIREINAYTTQFLTDKITQEERRNQTQQTGEFDINTIRLISAGRDREYGRIYFQGEYPFLYRLHVILGKCYEIENQPYRALGEYATAFRYTGYDFRDDAVDANSIIDRYRLMLDGFADPDRIAQENDPEIKTAAAEFLDSMKKYDDLKVRLEEAKKGVDVARARLSRGIPGDTEAQAAAKAQALQTEMDSLLASLEKIRTGAYKKYYERKRERDGDLAYTMAVLIRKLEIENKNLSRILNRSSFYRGLGNEQGEEVTELRNFVGYAIFLEMAHRIDPDNLKYLTLLSQEYRNSRSNDRAAAFEENYVRIASAMNPQPSELPAHYRTLAGLYTDLRNYILAAQTCEKYLEKGADPDGLIRLQLADIYFQHTGAFPRSERLYREVLEESMKTDEQTLDFRKRSEIRSFRYRVLQNLASINRLHERPEKEKADIESAREQYMKMEREYADFDAEEKKIREEIMILKRQLLSTDDQRLRDSYHRLQNIELAAAVEKTRFLRVRLNSLNLPRILERRAMLCMYERDFTGALNIYREIIHRGTGEQATRARQNIEMINLTLRDGVLRRPAIDPIFER